MLFSNLLIAIALTTLWPLVLLGLLAASAWLERRTLIPEEVVPWPVQRMEAKASVADRGQAVSADRGRPEPGKAPGELAVPGRATRFALLRRPARGRHERR